LLDDPNEYGQRARCYAEFARNANIPEAREHFAKLASSWVNLAKEVEGALRSSGPWTRSRPWRRTSQRPLEAGTNRLSFPAYWF
jgi:hypothetical protein